MRTQETPCETLTTCLSLRATTGELMLAATKSLSLRATTLWLRTTTRELILLFSSLSLRATTLSLRATTRELILLFRLLGPVRPTPGGFLFCLLCPGGLLPCATTLSLRVTMRSSKGALPLPMAGRRQRPNRTRARCLFTGGLQRRTTSLPVRNVLVVLLRRRRAYEGAHAPRRGASPPSPPI